MHIREIQYRRLALLTIFCALGVIASPLLDRPSPTTAGIPANTYVVTTNGDGSDALPGDLTCDTGSGDCTLRAAIEEVNAGAGAGDAIHFNISGSVVITPPTNLPAVELPVAIDGTTQCVTPPCVRLIGGTFATDGLILRGGFSTIRGFIIGRFPTSGITLEQFGGNFISGNRIGTGPAGTTTSANGIGIIDNSPGSNTIGGTVAGARNLISGNTGHGIEINGATLDSIVGNYIGTEVTATAALGNGGDGIALNSANQNTIGNNPGQNVISGNGGSGVSINGDSNGVRNNSIGVNSTNDGDVGNGQHGIVITTGTQNVIGGSGNFQVISGNGGDGVQITGANSSSNYVIISFIGLDGSGSVALGNTGNGVHLLNGAHDNFVGAQLNVGQFNVISGNGQSGVLIEGAATINNVVSNSFIGTSYSGNADLGNGGDGVRLVGTGANRVGGDTAAFWPAISGNQGNGVYLYNTSGVVLQGTYIGTNAGGTADLGNAASGIYIENSANTQIGASTAAKRNIISGNDDRGIWLTGPGATGTTVEGTYIGTNAAGTAAIPNTSFGIHVHIDAANTTIGGSTAGAGNLISGNSGSGVAIQSTGNTVRGNKIGTDAAGTAAIPNQQNGIIISLVGPGLNNIGGYVPSIAPNTIAFNYLDGVYVAFSTANPVRANSIHSNGGLGIRNINGGNAELAPPVITTVTQTTIAGTACANCIVDIYYGPDDEGKTLHTDVGVNGSGQWTLTATVSGSFVTAVAKDASNNTSQFGAAVYDSDGDGIVNGLPLPIDNCPAVANPLQEWSDRNFIDQTPPSTQDDRTWPRSDPTGDACDTDDDNDGILDISEPAGCNGSGPLSPTNRDTDGDRVRDGAECTLGTNPTSAASKPTAAQCAAHLGVGVSVDTDGDRLFDRIEYCAYNTDPTQLDTDQDQDAFPLNANPSVNLIRDGCEAASLNNDRAVNSADQLLIALEIAREIDQTLRLVSMDINKDGGVNSGDQLLMVGFIVNAGSCP